MGVEIISYDIDADKKFKASITRALGVVDDLRIPFSSIAKDFYRSEKAIFNLKGPGQYPPFTKSEGGIEDVSVGKVRQKGFLGFFKKKRLKFKKGYVSTVESPYQIYKKKKYGFDYPLLKASGALEASVTGPNSPNSILAIDKQFLAIGTSLEYAGYHQFGNKRLPMRKFLFIGPESKEFASNKSITGRLERWNNIINNYILRKMGATSAQASGKE